MINTMDFKECEKKFFRKVRPDAEKIKAILKAVEKRKEFVESLLITQNNISFIFENYYEIIKELLIAFLLKNGLRSKNHQCLFSYFYKKFPQYEYNINLLLQMSFLRNRLDYYGELVEKSFYDKNKSEIKKVIDLIKKLVEADNE